MKYNTYRFSNVSFQLIGDAVAFEDVHGDSFAQHYFHGGGMAEPHHDLHDDVYALAGRRHPV